jgi:hypothetical protein
MARSSCGRAPGPARCAASLLDHECSNRYRGCR